MRNYVVNGKNYCVNNSSMDYTYDAKGNVTQLVSNYTWYSNNAPITQTFVYDSTDQLTNALGEVNQTTLYSASVSYANWGKIGRYTTSINGSDTFMYPMYGIINSTVFAPDSSINGNRTTYYNFGINGSLRRKMSCQPNGEQIDTTSEYYLFNAFNCMKAYSFNGERYAYYGYDASGERTYKMNLTEVTVTTNQNGIDSSYLVCNIDNMMLYPNGYINIDQNGYYTKHYYADALRIASKIGNGFNGNICDSVTEIESDYPGYLSGRMTVQNDEMREELNELSEIDNPIDNIGTIPDFCNLNGSLDYEIGLYFYHPDHLGSTGMVTDNNANIQQGFLYAPFGEILQEYSGLNYNVIPKFAFNAKELDEENGMYYYSARYYAPPTFISRDPMFEKYPSISPYTYCANNPLIMIDPTGEKVVVTGDEADADAAVTQMQSRTQNLKFSRDTKTGEISVTGEASTPEEKYMVEMIKNDNITATITATKNENTSNGTPYDIDGFLGVTFSKDANGVKSANSTNIYNVKKGENADKKVNSPGNFIWHAISEGYEAGKIAISKTKSEGPAYEDKNSHPIYNMSHYMAGKFFPGQYSTFIHKLILYDDLRNPFGRSVSFYHYYLKRY